MYSGSTFLVGMKQIYSALISLFLFNQLGFAQIDITNININQTISAASSTTLKSGKATAQEHLILQQKKSALRKQLIQRDLEKRQLQMAGIDLKLQHQHPDFTNEIARSQDNRPATSISGFDQRALNAIPLTSDEISALSSGEKTFSKIFLDKFKLSNKSQSNARTAVATPKLLKEILQKDYDPNLGKFTNSSIFKFTYTTANTTYIYEFKLDEARNIGDTLSIEYKDYDPVNNVNLAYEYFEDLNGRLVKTRQMKDLVSFYDGNNQLHQFYKLVYSASIYYDSVSHLNYLSNSTLERYDDRENQIEYTNIYYETDGPLSSGMKLLNQYDLNNRMISSIQENYDQNTQSWIPTLIYEYTFDAQGHKTLDSYLQFDMDGNYIDSSRELYAFDSNGNKTLDAFLIYDDNAGKWITQYQYKYEFDGQSNMLLEHYELYDSSGVINQGYKDIYEYDLKGEQSHYIHEKYIKLTQTWVKKLEQTSLKNTNGDPTLTQNINYDDDGNITTGSSDNFVYNNNAQLTVSYHQYFDLNVSQWITNSRDSLKYDDKGNLIEQKKERLRGDQLEYTKRYRNIIEDDALREAYVDQWDNNNSIWLNDSSGIYTYPPNSQQILVRLWDSNKQEWIDHDKFITVNQTDNLGNKEKYYLELHHDGSKWVKSNTDTTKYLGNSQLTTYYAYYEGNMDNTNFDLIQYNIDVYNQDTLITYFEDFSIYGATNNKSEFIYNDEGKLLDQKYYETADKDPSDGLDWALSYWWKYDYDANNNVILNQYYAVGWGYKFEYAYDGIDNKNWTTQIYSETNDINYQNGIDWSPRLRTISNFDNNGKRIYYEYWNFNSGGYKEESVFNPDGFETSKKQFNSGDHDGTDGIDWTLQTETTKSYNEQDQLTEYLQKKRNTTTDLMENKSRYINDYDENGNKINYENYTWDTNDWLPLDKTTWQYNSSALLLTKTNLGWLNSNWIPIDSLIYEYDADNYLIREIHKAYNKSTLVSGNMKIYSYANSDFNTYCQINISGDSVLIGDHLTMSASIASGNAMYTWMDSSRNILGSQAEQTLNAAGIYTVNADNGTCRVSQSTKIYTSCPLTISGDSILYLHDQVTFSAQLQNVEHATYRWYDDNDNFLKESNTLVVSYPNTYKIISYGGFCYATAEKTAVEVTDLEDPSDLNSFKIYPNPTHDLLTIRLPNNASSGTLSLLNIEGIFVWEKALTGLGSEVVLTLPSIKPGTYLIMFQGENCVKVSRLVIN